ncbi:MAG TPA: type II secretion system F family protein [Burkholderiaceae bacterium]|nr:type II secretion system F family protein [Burkholderiaceae bacterium]
MPAFQYRGRNQRGEVVKGRVEGVSADAVAAQLFNSGVTPIDIAAARADDVLGAFDALKGRFGGAKIGLLDLALFSRQMYTLLKAGVPIMQALRGLRDSTQNAQLSQVIVSIGDSLDQGMDLTAGLRRHPEVFSPLFVAMIQVGETTGNLGEAFLQLADYLEREKATRDRIKEATRYPMFVLIAMVVAIFILNLFVIPAFSKIYASFRIELPLPTKMLIASSNFTIRYWYIMLGVAIVAAIAIRMYVQTPEGRYRWHRLKLRLPVTGKIVYQATLARFARTLAIMIRAGVPLVQGMTVVSRAVDNDFIGERVIQMRDGVERGESIARTATATGMFPSLVVQMISVGEETGAVDELMFNVADYYEREVDYSIRTISDAIQPLLIVVLGVMVLILALGVFLPMWDLVQAARR